LRIKKKISAGVAIGVIFGVGVIAALIFFFIRKKKRSQGGYQLEKSCGGVEGVCGLAGGGGGNAAAVPSGRPSPPKVFSFSS
jgi:hypothetical protein